DDVSAAEHGQHENQMIPRLRALEIIDGYFSELGLNVDLFVRVLVGNFQHFFGEAGIRVAFTVVRIDFRWSRGRALVVRIDRNEGAGVQQTATKERADDTGNASREHTNPTKTWNNSIL